MPVSLPTDRVLRDGYTTSMKLPTPTLNLQVFIANHCQTCDYIEPLLAELRQNCPLVRVEIVNLSGPSSQRPTAVFATPTYMLNGRVISLGNPSLGDLLAQIEKELAAHG